MNKPKAIPWLSVNKIPAHHKWTKKFFSLWFVFYIVLFFFNRKN